MKNGALFGRLNTITPPGNGYVITVDGIDESLALTAALLVISRRDRADATMVPHRRHVVVAGSLCEAHNLYRLDTDQSTTTITDPPSRVGYMCDARSRSGCVHS